MTVGTEGPDNLTNDPNVYNEVVDALGGDDVVTVQQPFSDSQFFTSPTVLVNGGAGYDTLVGGGVLRGLSATGYDGSYMVRISTSRNYTVNWSSVEKLEFTGSMFGPDFVVSTGDAVAILNLSSFTVGNVTVTTGAADDQITLKSGTSLNSGGELTGNVLVNAGGGADLVDLSGINTSSSRTVFGVAGIDTLIGSS